MPRTGKSSREQQMAAAALVALPAAVTAAGIVNNGAKWWPRGWGHVRGRRLHHNRLFQVTARAWAPPPSQQSVPSNGGVARGAPRCRHARKHQQKRAAAALVERVVAAADAMTFATWRRRFRWCSSASPPTRRSASRGSGGTGCVRCRRLRDEDEWNYVGGGAVCTRHRQRTQHQVRRFVGVERTD